MEEFILQYFRFKFIIKFIVLLILSPDQMMKSLPPGSGTNENVNSDTWNKVLFPVHKRLRSIHAWHVAHSKPIQSHVRK